ncbi:MAG: 4Fe-4S single cluster domain-containing protein [Chthoniobacter sp.]
MDPISPVVQQNDVLRVARKTTACSVLGPGKRAVIWVQGCSLGCPGCVAPETHSTVGGEIIGVTDLANELIALPIDGVTISGGEPMEQAAPLNALIDSVRARCDMSFMAYSGYTIEHLQQRGNADQKAMLARLDILVDGPYVRSRHTRKRWRGSDNQTVHFLSPRHRNLSNTIEDEGDWIDVEVTSSGTLLWMGIPPPGFREIVEQQMAQRGVALEVIA